MEPLHPGELTAKWEHNTLTREDIALKCRKYAIEYSILVTEKEVTAMAFFLHRAMQKYHDPGMYIGEFVHALAGDSINEAFMYADTTSKKVLYIYWMYFRNCVPGDWRQRLSRP